MNLYETLMDNCTDSDLESFTELRGGKVAIKSFDLFKHFESSIGENYSFSEMLDALSNIARDSAVTNLKMDPTDGSLNNSRGRWFELLLFNEFDRILSKRTDLNNIGIHRLPSATADRPFCHMFIDHQRNELDKINPSTSNPDFVVVKTTGNQRTLFSSSSIINKFQDLSFIGNINMDDVISFISIKTSARPDRRYQQIYEANLIKALFYRFDKVINFISINMEHTVRNEEVYSSSSIISILKDDDEFSPAIDKAFVMNHSSDVVAVVNYIISR